MKKILTAIISNKLIQVLNLAITKENDVISMLELLIFFRENN